MARLPSALGKALCITTAATCLGLAPLAAHANVEHAAQPSIAGPLVLNPHRGFGPANQTSSNWFGYAADASWRTRSPTRPARPPAPRGVSSRRLAKSRSRPTGDAGSGMSSLRPSACFA